VGADRAQTTTRKPLEVHELDRPSASGRTRNGWGGWKISERLETDEPRTHTYSIYSIQDEQNPSKICERTETEKCLSRSWRDGDREMLAERPLIPPRCRRIKDAPFYYFPPPPAGPLRVLDLISRVLGPWPRASPLFVVADDGKRKERKRTEAARRDVAQLAC
jgi:hypothetical protein